LAIVLKSRTEKGGVSLKGKIGLYLFVFAAVLIALLFVFQMMLLEPMYEHEKIDSVKKTGDAIANAIDEDDLTDVLFATSMHNDTCISVTYNDASLTEGNQFCTVFSNMSTETKSALIGYASVSKNNTYVAVHDRSLGKGSSHDTDSSFKDIIYTRIVKADDGDAIIMVYSGISPVSATRSTLSVQLLYITLMIVAAIIILTFLINRNIAKPLTEINQSAKQLPQGRYEVNPRTNKYREAEELNETLAQAANDIQKADKAKRDLIANVSHDLRTPLTMISGYGEMMRDLPGEKTDENCQVIIDEAQRLNVLVNDLLDLSKLQENKIRLEKTIFDLSAMLDQQLKKYDVYTYQEGFNIEHYLLGEVLINADLKRMEQVFNNFMTNAINYSGKNKHIIVRETLSQDGSEVKVEIQDFGEGIAKDKINDIWDRYYKIDKEHVRAVQGSGIGLSIVKQVLELHGFKYGVISDEGKGSTFWFKCPVIQVDIEDEDSAE
jgi:signal transduction histidine kinase